MVLREMDCETATAIDCEDGDAGGDLLRFFAPPAARPAFGAVEEQVISLARRDTLASLEAPGMIERAVRLLFGLRSARQALADPRLEALRRAVVVARHRRHLPDTIARELRGLGFGVAQVRAVEARALA